MKEVLLLPYFPEDLRLRLISQDHTDNNCRTRIRMAVSVPGPPLILPKCQAELWKLQSDIGALPHISHQLRLSPLSGSHNFLVSCSDFKLWQFAPVFYLQSYQNFHSICWLSLMKLIFMTHNGQWLRKDYSKASFFFSTVWQLSKRCTKVHEREQVQMLEGHQPQAWMRPVGGGGAS